MLTIFILSIIFLLLLIQIFKNSWSETFISSFWIFTLFYTLSYPIKYLFIVFYDINYIARIKPEKEYLDLALIYSFCFWLLIYFFYILAYIGPKNFRFFSFIKKKLDNKKLKKKNISFFIKFILLIMVCISFYNFFILLEGNNFKFSLAFIDNEQNEARVGNGPKFILYSLYLYSLFIFLFILGKSSKKFTAIFIFFILITAFLSMVLMGSRRPLFIVFYALLIAIYLYKQKLIYKYFLAIFPLLIIFLAPIAQVLRYSFNDLLKTKTLNINYEFFITSITSTFEGIEHLANYLSTASFKQILFGVDQGLSWLFNLGFAIIPRFLWQSKPYLYGSVAQQEFIYPFMYESGPGQSTLPTGIVVDSMFGFGIFLIIIFAFIYSRIFFFIDFTLFKNNPKPSFSLLISAILYINIFNIVRGGTSIISSLIIVSALSILIYYLNRIKLK